MGSDKERHIDLEEFCDNPREALSWAAKNDAPITITSNATDINCDFMLVRTDKWYIEHTLMQYELSHPHTLLSNRALLTDSTQEVIRSLKPSRSIAVYVYAFCADRTLLIGETAEVQRETRRHGFAIKSR